MTPQMASTDLEQLRILLVKLGWDLQNNGIGLLRGLSLATESGETKIVSPSEFFKINAAALSGMGCGLISDACKLLAAVSPSSKHRFQDKRDIMELKLSNAQLVSVRMAMSAESIAGRVPPEEFKDQFTAIARQAGAPIVVEVLEIVAKRKQKLATQDLV
jgi:hypothetical protein